MNLPRRKQIRLKNYDYSKKNAYFITICTYKRTNFFGDIYDKEFHPFQNHPEKIIVKWLEKLESKYPCVLVDRYIIMPDHIHVILFHSMGSEDIDIMEDKPPLPEIIKWFKTQTTNEYIQMVKNGYLEPFNKHIWQRSYYEHIIRNHNDYLETCKYIENNTLEWDCHHKS